MHHVQRDPVQVDQVVQAVIVQVVSADLVQADQVAQVLLHQGVLAVQVEIAQVVLVDLVQQVPGVGSLVRELQVALQVEHQAADQAVVQIQPVVVAIPRELLVSQAVVLQRAESQSAQSVKSSTT